MEILNRKQYADLIYERLISEKESIKIQFDKSKNQIGYFFIDNLLPKNLAEEIYSCFPKPEEVVLKKSLKEYKYIAAQMNKYNPILEEIIYAFQDPRIVKLVGEICEIDVLFPDDNLYAGGISMMGYENFLNPHLDNSHDKDRNLWRVLNLLYYVTSDWKEDNGGNLEVWPDGIKSEPLTIFSKFNRLAVMATHQGSWHSVSPIKVNAIRCCVSNYYFSPEPLVASDKFHVTSFRGRPEQKVRDLILKGDIAVRMLLRKIFKRGVIENPHVYKK